MQTLPELQVEAHSVTFSMSVEPSYNNKITPRRKLQRSSLVQTGDSIMMINRPCMDTHCVSYLLSSLIHTLSACLCEGLTTVQQAVERAVAEEGWKMLLLLRVSPLIPYTPLNYIMSITSIPFKEFFWASAVGLIPSKSPGCFRTLMSSAILNQIN